MEKILTAYLSGWKWVRLIWKAPPHLEHIHPYPQINGRSSPQPVKILTPSLCGEKLTKEIDQSGFKWWWNFQRNKFSNIHFPKSALGTKIKPRNIFLMKHHTIFQHPACLLTSPAFDPNFAVSEISSNSWLPWRGQKKQGRVILTSWCSHDKQEYLMVDGIVAEKSIRKHFHLKKYNMKKHLSFDKNKE